MIKYLLKNKGITIAGVKDMLNKNIYKLDENGDHGLKTEYYKESIQIKSKQILEKIKKIKKYGKKNSH